MKKISVALLFSAILQPTDSKNFPSLLEVNEKIVESPPTEGEKIADIRKRFAENFGSIRELTFHSNLKYRDVLNASLATSQITRFILKSL